MRGAYKILLVVVLPMLVLASYQFSTVQQTFDFIQEVRSGIFLESAREIKYANDVLFMTGIINSTLFEIHTQAELGDANMISQTVRKYREIQLQRYYSLQKLKETVSQSDPLSFEFLQVLDENRLERVHSIESQIAEIDARNESIISKTISMVPDTNNSNLLSEEVTRSNELTNKLAQDLAVFTNERYTKIETTSKLVGESEARAENTLNMVLVTGYLIAAIMVLFIYSLIMRPLERFARAIELGSMEKIEWRGFEPVRQDEIGIIYRALRTALAVNEPVKRETTRTETRRKRTRKKRPVRPTKS